MSPTLVAGVDSSTQSCKVVVRDAGTGELVRSGSAAAPGGHLGRPAGLVDGVAGGGRRRPAALDDVAAIAVGGQQHGMVCLDEAGDVVRDALLWNDTRSAGAAPRPGRRTARRRAGLGRRGRLGAGGVVHGDQAALAGRARAGQRRAHRRGVPAARLARPGGCAAAARLDAAASPTAATRAAPATGRRRPASTATTCCGWRSARGRVLPHVLGAGRGGRAHTGRCAVLGPGTGDNAAAALGVGRRDPATWSCRSGRPAWCRRSARTPTADPTGIVAGFADATGHFLPLVCTLNAALVLDSTARLLGVVARRAVRRSRCRPRPVPAGSSLVPYFDGERTPNRPDATGSLLGPAARHRDAGAPGPGGGRGPAVRAGRRPGRAARAGRRRSSGCCSSAAAPAPRRCAASRRRSSRRRSSCRRAGRVRRRRRGAPGRLGAVRRGGAAAVGAGRLPSATRPTRAGGAGALRRGARPDRPARDQDGAA